MKKAKLCLMTLTMIIRSLFGIKEGKRKVLANTKHPHLKLVKKHSIASTPMTKTQIIRSTIKTSKKKIMSTVKTD